MRCIIETKDIVLRLSRGDSFDVSYEKVSPDLFRVDRTDETIVIRQVSRTRKTTFSIGKNEAAVNVTLPADHLKHLSVAIKAGLAEVTDIEAGFLELVVTAGMIRLTDVTAHQTSLEINAGAVHMKSVAAGQAKMDVSAGSLRSKNTTFAGGARITNKMGEVNLKGALPEGAGYSARSTLGSMKVGGQVVSGMGTIRVEGDPFFEITNMTGSVRIS
ncbi:MAG: DUF4097 family beta strand repeat-containing protein [Flaviflexus sp.]|nr:DUF4097 family beta strand repeat-containing protein [Flaviflexus sp.]